VTVDRRETGELETSLFLRYRLPNYTYGSLLTAQITAVVSVVTPRV